MRSKKQRSKYTLLAVILSVLASGFLLFRTLRRSGRISPASNDPDKAIETAFGNTRFAKLIPYIKAQARHETGDFKSTGYRQNKNMFGMQRPRVRPTKDRPDLEPETLIIEGSPHAYFPSPRESALDLLLWFEQFNREPFPENVNSTWEYASELRKRRYFTDSVENYSKGLASWM